MASRFSGFPAEGLEFLRELQSNNVRDWFQPRKEIYETLVRAPMADLVETCNAAFARFAPAYITEPKKAIHRIYRDTRFSPDKTPYKTHISAGFAASSAEKESFGGFYFSVSPTRIEFAAGIYMPPPATLRAIRLHLLDHHAELTRLLNAPARRKLLGELHGETLTRPPKGFPAGHPADAYLRRKQWYFYDTALDPALAASGAIAKELLRRFESAAPVLEFLTSALNKSGGSHSDQF